MPPRTSLLSVDQRCNHSHKWVAMWAPNAGPVTWCLPLFHFPFAGRQSDLQAGEDTSLQLGRGFPNPAGTACRVPIAGTLSSSCLDPMILHNPYRTGLWNPIYRWQNRGSERNSIQCWVTQ